MILTDMKMNSSKNAGAKPPRFLTWLAILVISGLLPVHAADMFVYFGTHRSGTNVGFSLAHFDTDTGALTKPEFLIQSPAPAYFVIHPDGLHLYTCNSGSPGEVSAYEIEPHTGQLKFLNRVPAGGTDTSYVSLDQTGHYVLAANYSGGNIAVFAIKPDGSIGERTAFVQHTGSSVNPQRQIHAYAHSIIVDPSNRFALVADLGLDKVFVYRFNEKDGSLATNNPPFVTIKPGSGPRHVKFHPNGRWVYVISEIASTVTAFNWDSANGTLAEFQSVSALPADFKGTSTCAEIMVHPNGKFLYASNRGDDSLAVFAINQTTGGLTLVEHVPSGGKTPRNFAFDPTGKWILCSNQDSNNAFVFRVDENTGKLTQIGGPVSVPYPFCERFLPVQ
jgi:6-phosphogluconolactonase